MSTHISTSGLGYHRSQISISGEHTQGGYGNTMCNDLSQISTSGDIRRCNSWTMTYHRLPFAPIAKMNRPRLIGAGRDSVIGAISTLSLFSTSARSDFSSSSLLLLPVTCFRLSSGERKCCFLFFRLSFFSSFSLKSSTNSWMTCCSVMPTSSTVSVVSGEAEEGTVGVWVLVQDVRGSLVFSLVQTVVCCSSTVRGLVLLPPIRRPVVPVRRPIVVR